ncbi:LacI family DNA-binding transcriptional regulator [Dictyobacter aurantiacus]|uniref:LacI family transcriptional regulator n=1 Tax=Dictyobacter aurantiacus TaxID=1936993 RepID=A0A401ZHE3_9CHLR|nr:LacI family DNA-binding transcriptional regulator [Dictyobacter aurantiacus]GCE06287.1 LacI family transcriptional regulator [Dictyobacter aurantiacus]
MAEKGPRRVTSADVARASGVSRATVSYVLNNDPRQSIPPETRERVLKAVEELGYSPFSPARTLSKGQSDLILAVLPFEQVDPDLARTLKDLGTRLASHGFTLIWHVGEQSMTGRAHPAFHLTPAAILSYVDENDATAAAFLRQFNVPVIAKMSSEINRQRVGRTQVVHLAQRGVRRIVFAAPERQDVQWLAQGRLEGVRLECEKYGLEPPIVQTIPPDRAAARTSVQDALNRIDGSVGICCYNDEVAFAVLAALTDLNIKVPETVAVIGCDDIPLAQFSQPPLTTIRFDNSRSMMGLVDNILAVISGQTPTPMPADQLSIIARASA